MMASDAVALRAVHRSAVPAWIALGANLGGDLPQLADTLRAALVALSALPFTTLVRSSRLYRTAPFEADGPDYLNAVALLHTQLTAPDVLDALQRIEHDFGRQRPYKNAPRTLDLDLLFYGDARIDSPLLTVPHPRWHERAFVVVPLADVSPERVSPTLRAALADQDLTLYADT